MHSFWLILSSVFFGVAGVYCFLHPTDALSAVGLYAGFLVFFGGLSQLMRYFGTAGERRSRWQLVTAALDVLFGGWLLVSGYYVLLAAFLPFMMAGYILARGILLFVYYFRAKETVKGASLRGKSFHLRCRRGARLVRLYMLCHVAGSEIKGKDALRGASFFAPEFPLRCR